MTDENDMLPDDDILSEFVDEAHEHLSTLEAGLLRLEEAAGKDSELVSSLFRAMHSIKGAAGFMQLQRIVDLSHVAENLLSRVREGTLGCSPEMVDALLQACDLLRELLANPHGNEPPALRETIARLEYCMQAPEPDAAHAAPGEAHAHRPSTAAIPDHLLDRYDGGYLYVLHCDLPMLVARGVKDAAGWMRELSGIGTLLGVLLPDGAWQALASGAIPEAQTCDILLSSPLETDVLSKAILLDPDEIEAMDDTASTPPHTPAPESAAAPHESPEPRLQSALPAHQAPLIPPSDLAPALVGKTPPEPRDPVATVTTVADGGTQGGRSIRISVELMDTIMALAGELVLVRNQQQALLDGADTRVRDNVQRLDAVTTKLQEAIMLTRMQPIGNLFDKFPRIVRDLGRKLDKDIQLDLAGRDVELDKIILENLSDPLTHLIRNACDHGIEPPGERIAAGKPSAGTVTIRAFQEGGQIIIEIRDDGRGIDPARVRAKALEKGLCSSHELDAMDEKEIIALVMEPGFSTAETISEISGRGVGTDVVRACIESLGGTIEIVSRLGRGTRMLLRLPLTLAIIPSLIVRSGADRFAIPQVSLEELVAIKADGSRGRIETAHAQEVFRLRGRLLPVTRLSEILAHPTPFQHATRQEIVERHAESRAGVSGTPTHIAVVRTGPDRYGLIVDEIIGTEEIVVKPMHGALKRMRCFSGCTIMGDGRVSFILDIDGISQHADIQFTRILQDERNPDKTSTRTHRPSGGPEETHDIFVFRYGPEEQFAIPLTMVQRIESIAPEDIRRVGEREFVTRDGVSTYILRLDKVLNVSPPSDPTAPMHLLLCKYIRRPVGILISSIVDTTETAIAFGADSYLEDGILGSMNLHDRLTLFLDVFRLVEKGEPDWFVHRSLPAGAARSRKVLLVEDAEFFRHIVSRYLEDGGFEVVTAVNGRDALIHLNEEDFDIIVSDLVMPEMDGWSLAEEIRRRTKRRWLPMLALSSLQNETDRRKALQSGFDRYVPKFDRESFLNTIMELLESSRALPQPLSSVSGDRP